MNGFKIIKKRGREHILIIRMITCFMFIFGALFIIYVSTRTEIFTFLHVIIISICSIPLCFIYAIAVEKLGSGLGNVITAWSSRGVNIREQLAADLEIARHSKRMGRYQEALRKIELVLEKDPEFPDALYLKGQILWEGLKKKNEAIECFNSLKALLPVSEPMYRWAESYCQEIMGKNCE